MSKSNRSWRRPLDACPNCNNLKSSISKQCRHCYLSTVNNSRRRRGDLYTTAEDEIISKFIGLESVAEIADRCNLISRCNRTPSSVHQRAKRLGYPSGRSGWTSEDLSRVFGVTPKTTANWMKGGWLKTTTWGQYRMASEAQIRRFMNEYPWFYDYECIAKPFYELAEKIQKDDPWLTVSQVAAMNGLERRRVRGLQESGSLPFKYRPGGDIRHGFIMIRKSDTKNIAWRIELWMEQIRKERLRNLKQGYKKLRERISHKPKGQSKAA